MLSSPGRFSAAFAAVQALPPDSYEATIFRVVPLRPFMAPPVAGARILYDEGPLRNSYRHTPPPTLLPPAAFQPNPLRNPPYPAPYQSGYSFSAPLHGRRSADRVSRVPPATMAALHRAAVCGEISADRHTRRTGVPSTSTRFGFEAVVRAPTVANRHPAIDRALAVEQSTRPVGTDTVTHPPRRRFASGVDLSPTTTGGVLGEHAGGSPTKLGARSTPDATRSEAERRRGG